jgi:PST family polysaccharide transporter
MLDKLTTLREKLRPGLRKLISNTVWMFADRFFRLFVAFFVSVWVARYLGPAQFGLYNYAFTIIGILTPFAKLGLDQILIRDLARDPSCKDETLGTAFALKIIGGVVTAVLAVLAIYLLRPDNKLSHWLVGIMAVGTIFQTSEIISFWFDSQTRAKYGIWARNLAYLFASLIKIVLILIRAPLIAFGWATLIEAILAAIALLIVYQTDGNFLKAWQYSFQRANKLLQDSWPLIFSSFAILIYMQIDQIMIGQMMGDREVGLYTVAVKLSEVWYFVPAVITSSVFPSVVKAKAVSEKLYYERFQKLFNILSVLAYATALLFTLSSNLLVTLLYGSHYAEVGPVIAVYVWAGLFVSLGLATSLWITTEGLMRFSPIISTAGAVINIVLNYFLIPKYGLIGATIATVISQFFASCGAYAIHPKTKRIFVMQIKAMTMPGLPSKEWFK